VKAAAAPEDAETAAKKNHANQTLNISKTFDGKYRLDGWLGAEAGAEVAAAIEAFTRKRDPNLSVFEDPIGKAAPEALHQLARHATNHTESCNDASPSRHSLIVAITLEALQPGIGTADIQGHGTLTAGAARRLACDWGIIPAVLGTDSEILDLGSRNRLATPTIRRNIAQRDGGCLFPGCDRPPVGREAHHRQHHIDGGPTAEHNLDLFCPFHHHLVHEGGWSYHIIDKTTLAFQPPDGRPRSSANADPSSTRTSTGGCIPNPPSASKHPAEHEQVQVQVQTTRCEYAVAEPPDHRAQPSALGCFLDDMEVARSRAGTSLASCRGLPARGLILTGSANSCGRSRWNVSVRVSGWMCTRGRSSRAPSTGRRGS
jgi:hypothetical protein